jgi:acetyl-CoA synthetase
MPFSYCCLSLSFRSCLDVVYGPLSNRATTVVYEGVPTYPDVSRFWNIVDKHQVNIFYTAPTAIRSLMAHDDAHVTKTSRQSLKILGTVGEPINPEAWRWYNSVVGKTSYEFCTVSN